MNEPVSARAVGSLFLAFGLLMLLLTAVGVWLVEMFSPISFIIGVWLTSVGLYQIGTNTSSMTPPEEIPRWWVPGIVVVSVLSLGGALGLVVFTQL